MRQVFLKSDSIISPMGFGSGTNLQQIRLQQSALKLQKPTSKYPSGYYAGILDNDIIDHSFSLIGNCKNYSKLEKMLILAINDVVIKESIDFEHTALVIATTKGNIDLLNSDAFTKERVELWKMAQVVADFFEFQQKPIVVSNACISGGLAIKTAADFIKYGKFDSAIVAAGDLVSDFVLSGFQSFQAMSELACKPFDARRNGISLGEAAAAVYLDTKPSEDTEIEFIHAVTTNDANHISGPSRDGEGLYQAISRLKLFTGISSEEIDFISAHGTATVYNDEMEALAFSRSQLDHVPLHSLKGYLGHTLGASALIESIMLKHGMLNNEMLISKNFENLGTSVPLNITTEVSQKELGTALKTASGFGGCNIAMLFEKTEAHE
ncbi:beta-ketoacyl synthase N-terminal-like domain-containing protein [Christiangramia portivictoriae]|uniref:beta-ketoacyl synthase N-terminal-like domain-containing protein n=1 Tax=Christiangramia portivictoriae TaxID=326069 RepID=UPI000417364D|nr:beta-ketoacyl synthase N-terminal-like domain-containing protein [Christiangramia portivictoriae]